MDAAKKQKGHGNTSSDTAVSLKKGAEITPPVFHFFKKENGGLKYDFQTADISNRKIVVEQRFCVWGVIYRKEKADNNRITPECYRLCVYASGSVITQMYLIGIN